MGITAEMWKSDWRNRGQEGFLQKAVLHHDPYKAPSATWTHDHCEFCWATIDEDRPDTLHSGYTTEDAYNWICEACFQDLKDIFVICIIDIEY